MRFFDRRHAGQILARRLHSYRDNSSVIVLALPRGGVRVSDQEMPGPKSANSVPPGMSNSLHRTIGTSPLTNALRDDTCDTRAA